MGHLSEETKALIAHDMETALATAARSDVKRLAYEAAQECLDILNAKKNKRIEVLEGDAVIPLDDPEDVR